MFLSYQWGKQPQVKALYQRLTSLGYTVWMDIYQMGGGDSLYDEIDRGMRGCKAVVTCVTQKYSLSANCRREISLADALKKPIIPLLLEQMKWPPDGPMSMVFTELLYINFYRDETVQMTWQGEQFDELKGKLRQFVPGIASSTENDNRNQTSREDQNKTMIAVTAGDEAEVAISQERKDKNQRPRENQGKDIKPVSTVKKTTESVATANRKPTTTNKTDDKIKSEPDIKEGNKSGDNKQTPVKKRAPVSQVVVAKVVSVNAFNKDKGSKQDTSANGKSAANKKPDSNSLTKFKKTGPNPGLASDGKTDNNNGKQRRNPASVQSEAIPKAPSKDKLYSDSVAKEKGNGNIVKHGREPEDVQPNQIQTGNDQKKSSTCNIL